MPEPQSHEVQVEIHAFGLNFADIFAIFGLYSATPAGEFVPGLEFSGIVTAVGRDVMDFTEGQRVMGVSRFGGYTNGINQDARYVTPLPDNWSFEMGAAYLVQVLTAYYGLLELGNMEKIEKPGVLIHSAAGGVGIWANRIAKYFDAYTIGTVGSTKKLSFLMDEGYDKGIVRGGDFAIKLKEAKGDRSINIVMDCIGGEILMEGYKQMAPEGRLISYGSARYAHPGARPNKLKLLMKYITRPKLDPQKMIEQNKAVMGFNLIYLFEKTQKMRDYLDHMAEMNLGKPHVGHTFEFMQLTEALDLFLSGKTTGKVVIRC